MEQLPPHGRPGVCFALAGDRLGAWSGRPQPPPGLSALCRLRCRGIGQLSVWGGLRHQLFLGGDRFAKRLAGTIGPLERLREVPKAQRRTLAKQLAHFEQAYPAGREAMARAF